VVNAVTDSDLIALSLLGIRVTGYQVLRITGRLAGMIRELLAQIPPQARIDDEDAGEFLARRRPGVGVVGIAAGRHGPQDEQAAWTRGGGQAAGPQATRLDPDLR